MARLILGQACHSHHWSLLVTCTITVPSSNAVFLVCLKCAAGVWFAVSVAQVTMVHIPTRQVPTNGKTYGPAISGNPVVPVAVGKGRTRGYISWQTLDEAIDNNDPDIFDNEIFVARRLVIINDNQKAYRVGRLGGSM